MYLQPYPTWYVYALNADVPVHLFTDESLRWS